MKQKLILIVWSLLILLLSAGCGSISLPVSEQQAETGSTAAATPVETPEPTPAAPTPTPEPTPEPTPTPVPTATLSGNSDLIVELGTEEIDLPDDSYLSSLIEQAELFADLRKIDLGNTEADASTLESLRSAFPSCIITYTFSLEGVTCRSNDTSVDVSSLDESALEAICEGLKKLPSLSYIELMREDGTSPFSLESVSVISDSCPWASVNYTFELFGQTVSTSQERLEYVKVSIGNNGVEQIRQVLPFMSNLKYLLLDSCDIDYEVLAQLRDDFPETEVVWRVVFSYDGYNCLTDTEKIWATGQVTDGYTGPLKYCTKVKYLDLGHNCITNIDFVNYMPDLEVAIFAITWVADISPLAKCPNLEYLEIFSSNVTDITPLANCTNLEYLNMGNLSSVRDISCLYGLTKLKALWCTMSYIPQEQQDTIRQLLPDCEFDFNWIEPDKEGWRTDENGERTERYALLCEQFGYDTFDYSK